MDFAVWWSILLLFLAALSAFSLFCFRHDNTRYAFLALAALFAALSIDELGSIHERLGQEGGWAVYIPFAIAAGVLVVYILVALFRSAETRTSAWILLAAFLLLLLVPLLEYLGDALVLTESRQGMRATLEEGIELLVSTLFLWATVRLRDIPDKMTLVRGLLPTGEVFKRLPAILYLGAILHVAIVILMSMSAQSERWGDASAWYPAGALIIASFAGLHLALNSTGRSAHMRLLFTGALLAASAAVIYLFASRTAGWLMYVVDAGLIIGLFTFRRPATASGRRQELYSVAALSLLVAIGAFVNHPVFLRLVTGVFALGLALMCVNRAVNPSGDYLSRNRWLEWLLTKAVKENPMNRLIMESAAGWNVSARTVLALFYIPIAVALLMLASYFVDPRIVTWLGREDRVFEWASFVLFAAGGILALVNATRLFRSGRRWYGLIYIGAGLLFLFVAGEEISWGQRVFGWQTPQEIAEINRQGETNLHNMPISAFQYGPLLVCAYGGFIYLINLRLRVERFVGEAVQWLIPPLFLASPFVITFFSFLPGMFRLVERTAFGLAFVEGADCSLAFGVFVYMCFVERRLRARTTENTLHRFAPG
jgi:hypothetical protein